MAPARSKQVPGLKKSLIRSDSGKGLVILTPRATLAGFGALALAALAAAAAGLAYPAALPFGAGALAGLAGAFAVMRSTFSSPLAAIGGFSWRGLDPLASLQAHLAALEAAREAAMAQARAAAAEAAQNAAEAEALSRQRESSARSATTHALAAALKALADGDLTVRIEAPELAREFDAAVALYGKTVFALASSAAAIGARVRDIAADAEELAEGARAEAARASPARAALRAAEGRIADIVREGRQARETAASLGVALNASFAAIEGGVAALERVARARATVGERLESIENFALQTHLIALNAGVEAARAGDAGRGIAIVAQELRGVSQRSTDATRELKTALAALIQESDKSAAELREILDRAERVAPPPAAAQAPDAGLIGQLEAALQAAETRADRDVKAGEAVGEASRSLEALVGKLAALAGHFRLPGAPRFEMAPPPAPLRALPAPRPRLRAG